MRKWLVAALVLLLGRGRRRVTIVRDRILPPGEPDRAAENRVLVLFACSSACAIAFVVVYGVESLPARTQLFGISIGLAFAFASAAFLVIGRRLVPQEEEDEEYAPEQHPTAQEEIEQLVDESGERFTRRRLLWVAGGGTFTAIGVALAAPAASLGPFFDVDPLYATPWRPGRRLVDERGRPWRADAIEEKDFYTAYPEGASREELGSPLVVVRLPPDELDLPPERRDWDADGIVAYSKICTHAGCAVALYRVPTFAPVEPKPALVCPCHYSTFDPATGGSVLFGPAGRPLPQLPLRIDRDGVLRARGTFSGAIGPAWWGIHMHGPRTR